MKNLGCDWKVDVESDCGLECKCVSKEITENVMEHSFVFTNCKQQSATPSGHIILKKCFPHLDTSFMWHPLCDTNRKIATDWSEPIETMTSISAPVVCLMSEDSQNRCTVAISEINERIKMLFGVHEEDGTMMCKVTLPIPESVLHLGYELKLLEDRRDIPYYQAINHISKWWETTLNLEIMKSTEEARMPVYSTWYAYHQNLFEEEIEAECKVASELGLKSIIVDDGWQTMDNNRGYAFCGEWEVAEGRFKDFASHIQKVHDMGMKYLIWYSVPFIGKKSTVWHQFRDKLLRQNDALETGILDPRYPQTREYLIHIYETAVSKWQLDGLKLDFIDQFYEDVSTPIFNSQMDFVSVQEALDFMMLEIKRRLQAIKPDIMIEFRQRYIGPNMRKYGNMFRVTDCPTSGMTNRVGIADLRLLSGDTAIHSDMLMWHKNEKPEIAALQIIHSIFGTLQLSVKLGELSLEQTAMLKFWISFMKEHCKLLQESEFIPYEPQLLYPIIQVREGVRSIIAVYSQDKIIKLDPELEQAIVLNGTKQCQITMLFEQAQVYEVVEKDCFGNVIREITMKMDKGFHQFPITTAGLLALKRLA